MHLKMKATLRDTVKYMTSYTRIESMLTEYFDLYQLIKIGLCSDKDIEYEKFLDNVNCCG